MADEARSLKAYGELPESIRVNETDTFDEERGENDECARRPCCRAARRRRLTRAPPVQVLRFRSALRKRPLARVCRADSPPPQTTLPRFERRAPAPCVVSATWLAARRAHTLPCSSLCWLSCPAIAVTSRCWSSLCPNGLLYGTSARRTKIAKKQKKIKNCFSFMLRTVVPAVAVAVVVARVIPFVFRRVKNAMSLTAVKFGENGDIPGLIGGEVGAPGVVLIQEWWGINQNVRSALARARETAATHSTRPPNAQVKDLGARMVGNGFRVLIPDICARLRAHEGRPWSWSLHGRHISAPVRSLTHAPPDKGKVGTEVEEVCAAASARRLCS